MIPTQDSEHWKIDEQNVGSGRPFHTGASCLQMGNNHQVWGEILPQTQGRVFIFVATSVLPASGTPCSVSVTEVIEWAAQTVPWKQAALVPDRSRRGPGVLAPLPSAILPEDLLLSRLGNRVTHTLRCYTVCDAWHLLLQSP